MEKNQVRTQLTVNLRMTQIQMSFFLRRRDISMEEVFGFTGELPPKKNWLMGSFVPITFLKPVFFVVSH